MDNFKKQRLVPIMTGALLSCAILYKDLYVKRESDLLLPDILKMEIRQTKSDDRERLFVNEAISESYKSDHINTGTIIQTSYISTNRIVTNSDNVPVKAKELIFNTLYPLLYDQRLGPYVIATFRDIAHGNVKGAENLLLISSRKAEAENNSFAVNRINFVYMDMTGKKLQYEVPNRTSISNTQVREVTNIRGNHMGQISEYPIEKSEKNVVASNESRPGMVWFIGFLGAIGIGGAALMGAGYVIFYLISLPGLVFSKLEKMIHKNKENDE